VIRRLAVLTCLWSAASCAPSLAPARQVSPGVSLRPHHREPALVIVRHRVEPGQTLYRIARTYGLTPEELATANRLEDPRALSVGQELVIPGAQRVLPVEVHIEPATPIQVAKLPKHGQLEWPLRGVLYARFGRKGKEAHDGIDLAAPLGTPVKAAKEGKVLFAGEQKGYGLIAILEHSDGLVTLYAHNRDLRVSTGQKVRGGQVIATVGESGRTSGPHLHFEVRKEGLPVDPLTLLGTAPN
jgi:lipoprotein NlpD